MTMVIPGWVSLHPAAERALKNGRPLVALESAVFSHGLPPSPARDLARDLTEAVLAAGATPACIAVRSGWAEVGLGASDLEFLFAPGVMKLAARDLAVAVAQRRSGGTTVAGTLAVAHACGIRVMSTGGIGGVHLGAGAAGDVSADLPALAEHPLVVVCAGPKAVCDPRRTMEMLDTLGVTVVGYGTSMLPGFLAASAGVPVPHRVDDPAGLAAIAEAKRRIGDRAALLVAQPPPSGAALDPRELDRAVSLALERAAEAGVEGADLTPYLLATLAEVTGGRSVAANVAVLVANARLAAEIAVAIASGRPSSA